MSTDHTPAARERLYAALWKVEYPKDGRGRFAKVESIESRLERFTAYCPVSGCWFWLGALRNGYGAFYVAGRVVRAHRVSYELHRGPIPDGMHLDHLCRQPSCINPDHLEAVTQRENTLRGTGWAAVNAAKTHCKRGHPFSGENLGFELKGRLCRRCATLKSARRRMEARAVRGEQVLGERGKP